ncbi:hypothetical protein SAMN03080598_02421 [Algoriphagus boritolerans DSM 17298 = JCM 18970]|uniref:Uncharacterized protein n=1 Tax=Algoriphagus boritolerans DSM 17298 = JCM 18970 TaxID=1120964 RepID=A0A1H5X9Q8_9BACT|nr:hypothetical protein SAMN03080598_02421 [Algoriphagus boritolerans DSM 17298 = JCM 18970]
MLRLHSAQEKVDQRIRNHLSLGISVIKFKTPVRRLIEGKITGIDGLRLKKSQTIPLNLFSEL